MSSHLNDAPLIEVPWLLVDGYNVIGAWHQHKGKKTRQSQRSIFSNAEALDTARLQLIEILTGYSAFQGYRTEVVFDAYAREGGGHTEQFGEHLTVCFTESGQTADTYIEKVCAMNWQNRHHSAQRIIVATSDHTHKVTVLGYGAEWMSAQRLHEDVHVVNHMIRQKQQTQRTSIRRGLAHQLDPQAKARLEQMRFANPPS
jgi:predicted RNA-binding protein with PIN domain